MDECIKFRHFCKEDENNARRNQKNLRKMTLTDKEKLEAIKKVFDDIPIPVQGFSDSFYLFSKLHFTANC
jgi:adenylate cyclase class IV